MSMMEEMAMKRNKMKNRIPAAKHKPKPKQAPSWTTPRASPAIPNLEPMAGGANATQAKRDHARRLPLKIMKEDTVGKNSTVLSELSFGPTVPLIGPAAPAAPAVPVQPVAAPLVPARRTAAPPVPVRKSAAPAVPVRKSAAPAVPSRKKAAPFVPSRMKPNIPPRKKPAIPPRR